MWLVKLTKPLPIANSFRENFFPRKCRYKSQAVELRIEVKRAGGEAEIVLYEKEKPK